MLRNKVTGLILGGIAALGITAGATTAFAQSTDATAPAVQSAAGADTLANNELAPRGPGMGNRGAMGGEMLANALGITQAELQTAMQKIPELAIAKAVENGDITQEQADQMTQGNGMRGLMALGVNIDRLFAMVFGFGAMLAGFAGMMAAPILAVEPNMGDNLLILAFVVIVIGGIGSVRGAFLAALIIGFVDTMGRSFATDLMKLFLSPSAANDVGPALASMLIYILMAVVLFFRPAGLFPARGT